MGLGHFFMFLVSGALTVWIFYRGITQTQTSWPDYLQTRQWPRLTTLLLGILLMAASMPLVLYSLNINQQIPLPEFFKTAELQAAETLKGLLQMEHAGELLANLVIIALLPALGEELVFRGVVQQQLMRRIANPLGSHPGFGDGVQRGARSVRRLFATNAAGLFTGLVVLANAEFLGACGWPFFQQRHPGARTISVRQGIVERRPRKRHSSALGVCSRIGVHGLGRDAFDWPNR
jgi:membrane protease YdiL (CAAX protease family)